MPKNKKAKLILITIMFDFILVICLYTLRQEYNKQLLIKEIKNLNNVDITSISNYSNIKSSGNYKTIEKAIKNYLTSYSNILNKVNNELEDDKLTNILSIDNIKEDSPNFENTLSYLNEEKDRINNNINKLISMSNSKNKTNNIYEYTNNNKLISLYNSLFSYDISSYTNKLEDKQEEINNILDVYLEAINFLKDNKDNYVIEDNKLQFKTQELLDQYNNITSKLNK